MRLDFAELTLLSMTSTLVLGQTSPSMTSRQVLLLVRPPITAFILRRRLDRHPRPSDSPSSPAPPANFASIPIPTLRRPLPLLARCLAASCAPLPLAIT